MREYGFAGQPVSSAPNTNSDRIPGSIPPPKVTGYEGNGANPAPCMGTGAGYDLAYGSNKEQRQQNNADLLVDLSVLSVFSDRKLLNNTVSTLRNEAMKLFLEADCYESLAEALEKFFD